MGDGTGGRQQSNVRARYLTSPPPPSRGGQPQPSMPARQRAAVAPPPSSQQSARENRSYLPLLDLIEAYRTNGAASTADTFKPALRALVVLWQKDERFSQTFPRDMVTAWLAARNPEFERVALRFLLYLTCDKMKGFCENNQLFLQGGCCNDCRTRREEGANKLIERVGAALRIVAHDDLEALVADLAVDDAVADQSCQDAGNYILAQVETRLLVKEAEDPNVTYDRLLKYADALFLQDTMLEWGVSVARQDYVERQLAADGDGIERLEEIGVALLAHNAAAQASDNMFAPVPIGHQSLYTTIVERQAGRDRAPAWDALAADDDLDLDDAEATDARFFDATATPPLAEPLIGAAELLGAERRLDAAAVASAVRAEAGANSARRAAWMADWFPLKKWHRTQSIKSVQWHALPEGEPHLTDPDAVCGVMRLSAFELEHPVGTTAFGPLKVYGLDDLQQWLVDNTEEPDRNPVASLADMQLFRPRGGRFLLAPP